MSRLIFAAFTFMVLFSVATAGECPGDEVYLECGTACPPTCADPDPDVCTKQCAEGCFCEDDLVRNSEGECIPEAGCPPNN